MRFDLLKKIKDILKCIKRGGNRKNNYSKYFNPPMKLFGRNWYMNERIIEEFYVHNHIGLDGKGKRVLEFGCTKSILSLK